MRVGNLGGRAVVIDGDRAVDVAVASDGRFGPDPMDVLAAWPDFASWAGSATLPAGEPFDETDLLAPVPRPAQVFTLMTNHPDGAALPGMSIPEELIVLTKFRSSLTGPFEDVSLGGPMVDYETAVVVAVGRGGRGIPADEAWDHVAGVCVGQDLSDRDRMLHASVPQQFSMAKSFAGAGPFGPYLVTPDEFDDPDDIPYSATLEGPGVDGVLTVQAASTGELVYGVPEVIARLSETVELLPGDLIFMGTPRGIGLARGQLLRPGVVLTSILDDVARMRTTFSSQLDPFPVPPPPPGAPAGPPPR
ncbi:MULTISPECIES: fumarylacetoacetate hydrolase family protein [unclassified Microbacterium]|uniref:fumarylacetoacetate hydrolase family protein n=1 Tax=unclassified Microbacterium TaxID=2609290 RepID=UPI00214C65AB|nr:MULTISPECIES: fumarylacetoacetate hydrolase family protein [unclassified Microbacterium]MCR2783980.1 fumarylacetoacetate hydrolase family protein [Microbacterium sp. zg.B96]WIM15176.1 fumarylacetoacetate hydrolase family protein [Microbacterium sp. zg-B96]